jgi:DNA-binding NtrC family response regulator
MKYVVVIDDEEIVEEFLEEFLREAYYREISFNYPEDAFDFIKENREEIALIITDNTMPLMTGVRLGEELMKGACQNIPLILFTGDPSPPHADDLSNNVKMVLQKPVIRKEFMHAVKTLIGLAGDAG